MSFTTDELPPRDSGYLGSFHCLFRHSPWLIRNPTHARFTQHYPPPGVPGQTTTHAFRSSVEFDLGYQVSLGPLKFVVPVRRKASADAAVEVDVTLRSVDPADGTRRFDTQLKKLDSAPIRFALGPFSTTALLALSDERDSKGTTSIRRRPDGRFDIASHFDVATKLSFDGGRTWHHSETKDHKPCAAPMDLDPEPKFPPVLPNIPPSG